VADIPERLLRNGRVEDQQFQASEKLFHRYVKKNYEQGKFLNVALSSVPSVNRGKYSQAEDVLISEADKYIGWGVVSFAVQDIPSQLLAVSPTHSFFPRHVPEDLNYAHSEVWCNRIGHEGSHVKPGNLVKKMFRALLGQRAVLEIEAQI
jgi:hypothetical protein